MVSRGRRVDEDRPAGGCGQHWSRRSRESLGVRGDCQEQQSAVPSLDHQDAGEGGHGDGVGAAAQCFLEPGTGASR